MARAGFGDPMGKVSIPQPMPAAPPMTFEQWESLRLLTKNALKALGLRAWNNPRTDVTFGRSYSGKTLMLLPGEWFHNIPEGFQLTKISGESVNFKRREMSNGIRCGVLDYGILVGS
jgi:hypothetical protein